MEDVESLLLADPSVEELAIVPDLDGRMWTLDGPLLLISQACVLSLVRKHSQILTSCPNSESTRILSSVFPDHPIWTRQSQFEGDDDLRSNTIALRFHINSSILWKCRSRISKQECDDSRFIRQVQLFKRFNYHLFEYARRAVGTDLDQMLQLVQTEPASFSPYHLILTSLSQATDIVRSVAEVWRRLEVFVDRLCRHDAYAEFCVSLVLLLKDFECQELLQAIAGRLDGSPTGQVWLSKAILGDLY